MKVVVLVAALAAASLMPAHAEPGIAGARPPIVAQAPLAVPVQLQVPAGPDTPADDEEQVDQPSPRALALAKVALASVLVGKCDKIEFQDEPLATFFLENIGELDSDTNDLLSGLAFAAATVLGDKTVQEMCDEAMDKFGPDGSEAKGLVARK
jgi:hypothetical protein